MVRSWAACIYFLLKKIRGERVRVETAFAGFKASLVHLFLAGFVTEVLTVLGFVCLILPGIYLFVAWFFTLPLVIDKRLDFWPAMRISRRIITRHWWKFLGFLLVLLAVQPGRRAGLRHRRGLSPCPSRSPP